MAVTLNTDKTYESTNITLSRRTYPIAYQNKLEELVEQGCYPSIKDAEQDNPKIIIELELYYDKHSGLFGVESGAIESHSDIVSPYDGTPCIYPPED